VAQHPKPTLHVCLSCRRAGPDGADNAEAPPAQPEGRALYEALAEQVAALGEDAPAHIRQTICFANCERGCTASLSSPGKWSYMVGGLGPEHAADLLRYAAAYGASETGVVLRSGRPESLHHAIVARFPAHDTCGASTAPEEAELTEPDEQPAPDKVLAKEASE
jgi:predicted metal-binding protein